MVKKTNLDARYVFIRPSSLEALENRLRARKSDTDHAVTQRLETAKKELEYADQPGSHDKIVVNDDIDKAFEELEAFALDN